MSTITWNPSHKDSGLTLSNGNLTATNGSGGPNLVTSTVPMPTSGKYYFEFTVSASGSGFQVGFLSTTTLGAYISSNGGCGYYEGGSSSGAFNYEGTTSGTVSEYYGTYVVGIAVDFTNGLFWVSQVAGTWAGNSTGGTPNPATGTAGMPLSINGSAPFYLAFSTTLSSASCTLNTTGSFSLTQPSGFGILPSTTQVNASNLVRESLIEATVGARSSAVIREALIKPTTGLNISSVIREALVTDVVPVHVSGLVRETLVNTTIRVYTWNGLKIAA